MKLQMIVTQNQHNSNHKTNFRYVLPAHQLCSAYCIAFQPHPTNTGGNHTDDIGWLGGSVVRALARDRKVESSTPGQSATK